LLQESPVKAPAADQMRFDFDRAVPADGLVQTPDDVVRPGHLRLVGWTVPEDYSPRWRRGPIAIDEPWPVVGLYVAS